MLTWRFFGGGLVAFGVAGALRLALDVLPPLRAYALTFGLGAVLMLISSTLFVSAGEPPSSPHKSPAAPHAGLAVPSGLASGQGQAGSCV